MRAATRSQPEWPGRKGGSYEWYEIQDNTAYFAEFLQPKILYQEIQYHPSYSLDRSGLLTNNKCCFITSDDPWLLAVLNSPLMWWYNWRHLGHAKDEALTPQGFQMEMLPIARCDGTNPAAPASVNALREIQTEIQEARKLLVDWYRGSLGVVRITNLLRDPFELDADEFVAAIQRARPARLGAFNTAAVRQVRAEHSNIIVPAARRLAEAQKHERALSELVNEAYGLTQQDVNLMWRTAPPRMPIAGPSGGANTPVIVDAEAEFVHEPSE